MLDLRLLLILFTFQGTLADRVVMTNTGPIQGITVEADDQQVEAFLGIPFAEPPVGRLRFAKPVPKTPWLGVLDASRLPPSCIQNVTQPFYYTPDIDNMTEDCLYLNVWVPRSPPKNGRLRPVLFFIHGGAFNIGASNMKLYDGAKFAEFGDMVVVTINYRIGVMGFFSAFIEEANGNMGLYDQIVALQWIHDNAKSFTGDPENIVVMGESAGAMCAAGHIISPLTKHMIKRVILESGAAVHSIILDDNARLYDTSQKLAKMVGCADSSVTLKSDPGIIVECLKRISAEDLSRAEGILMTINPITFFPRSGDSYLPNNTVQLIKDGKFLDTEMLIGVTKDEGSFFLTAAIPQYFGVYGVDAVKTISRRLAFQMTRMIYRNTEQTNEDEIADYYINGIENGTSDKYTKAISESIGDYMITCNAVFHSDFHSLRNNPVYFFIFTHRPSSNFLADWMGTTHFDEVQFIFGNPMVGNFTEEEEVLSHRMMKRWTSFIYTGNPNVDGEVYWPKYSFEDPEYMDIGIQETVRTRPGNFRCEFWRDRFQAGIDDAIIEKFRSAAVTCTVKAVSLLLPLLVCISYNMKESQFW